MSEGTFIRGLIAALWATAMGAGFGMLLRYQTASGPVGSAPEQWPTQSRIQRLPGRATLLMLAHPRCPCTRASVGELAWIMTRAQDRATAHVLFLRPAGMPRDWVETDLWKTAARIPGVSVLEDYDGTEARLLGAATSGHVLLFDPGGRLLYAGGITGSRGHPGSNAGRDAVLSALINGSPTRKEAPVFGCSLLRPIPADPAWVL